MKTLSTSRYFLEQINDTEFKISRRVYMPISTAIDNGVFKIHQDIIKGIEKNPRSGYWDEAIAQIIKGEGAIFEKYKI